ncbi:TPA: hypothetical protein JD348_25615 [Serratia marcescens]|nr:hypothetical protein [Serratia marcescens]HAU5732703.1 hypothetical protein [Serratia marcescens]HAU5753253.1 hypothetical protein [Serratia marcescens]
MPSKQPAIATGSVQQNALRTVAKRCNDELHAAIKQHPKTPFDTLSRPIIMKHFAQVELLGISLPRFNYTIGMLNGRFTER